MICVIATASRCSPPAAKVAKASDISRVEQPTAPPVRVRDAALWSICAASVSMPRRSAMSMTLSLPMASATCTYPVFDERAVASASDRVP